MDLNNISTQRLSKIHSIWCLSLYLTYIGHASKNQSNTVITLCLFMKHFSKGVENWALDAD